jgi:hypothetical protein
VRIYLTFLLHAYRTTRPGGITTVQLRSKLPHILRIIFTHTNYWKPHRILRICLVLLGCRCCNSWRPCTRPPRPIQSAMYGTGRRRDQQSWRSDFLSHIYHPHRASYNPQFIESRSPRLFHVSVDHERTKPTCLASAGCHESIPYSYPGYAELICSVGELPEDLPFVLRLYSQSPTVDREQGPWLPFFCLHRMNCSRKETEVWRWNDTC